MEIRKYYINIPIHNLLTIIKEAVTKMIIDINISKHMTHQLWCSKAKHKEGR